MFDNVYEPMQLDLPAEENNSADGEARAAPPVNESKYIVENPTIDLETYASQYSGLARIFRLLHLAEKCPMFRIDALKLALNYVKENTHNTSMYSLIYNRLSEAITKQGMTVEQAGVGPIDTAWIETRSKKGATILEKLDTDLKNYKSNSIKESIRRGHDDLGDHYLDLGDLNSALKLYSRSRDYCTSNKHLLNMCMNVIKVGILLRNWSHVINYAQKAENNNESNNSPIVSKLHYSVGLAELVLKKYSAAAKRFLQCNFDHFTGDADEILCPNNIAIYGGLTALATYNRSQLHKVITSASFKMFLELEPQLRDAINKFYESKYASCLSILEEIKDNLLLDMYLATHVKDLYAMIRNRALIQYFSPYLSADMHKMASAFNTNVANLENEIMTLILDGQMQARIDSHNKILYAKDIDQRTVTFEKAFKMGKEWQKRTKALILRSAVLKNPNICVRQPNRYEETSSNTNVVGVLE